MDLTLPTCSIISGVGMIEDPQMGYFEVKNDDYDLKSFSGIYDLSVIIGNISKNENLEYIPHVHVVFNNDEFKTFSGHLMEAKVHITMEIFLSLFDDSLVRKKIEGCPATRIIRIH